MCVCVGSSRRARSRARGTRSGSPSVPRSWASTQRSASSAVSVAERQVRFTEWSFESLHSTPQRSEAQMGRRRPANNGLRLPAVEQPVARDPHISGATSSSDHPRTEPPTSSSSTTSTCASSRLHRRNHPRTDPQPRTRLPRHQRTHRRALTHIRVSGVDNTDRTGANDRTRKHRFGRSRCPATSQCLLLLRAADSRAFEPDVRGPAPVGQPGSISRWLTTASPFLVPPRWTR